MSARSARDSSTVLSVLVLAWTLGMDSGVEPLPSSKPMMMSKEYPASAPPAPVRVTVVSSPAQTASSLLMLAVGRSSTATVAASLTVNSQPAVAAAKVVTVKVVASSSVLLLKEPRKALPSATTFTAMGVPPVPPATLVSTWAVPASLAETVTVTVSPSQTSVSLVEMDTVGAARISSSIVMASPTHSSPSSSPSAPSSK